MRSDERIDKGVLLWIILVERIENDRTDTRMYVQVVQVGRKCAGSRSVGRPPKRWIGIVMDCLKIKKGFDVIQARRMVYDRSE